MPSLETLAALASVFNVSVSELTFEPHIETMQLDNKIAEARKRVKAEGKLFKKIIIAIIICAIIYIFNYIYAPNHTWPIWIIVIWGGLLFIKALKLFILDKLFLKWEKNRLMSLNPKK